VLAWSCTQWIAAATLRSTNAGAENTDKRQPCIATTASAATATVAAAVAERNLTPTRVVAAVGGGSKQESLPPAAAAAAPRCLPVRGQPHFVGVSL
jgi:hypothetical protein